MADVEGVEENARFRVKREDEAMGRCEGWKERREKEDVRLVIEPSDLVTFMSAKVNKG